MARFEEFQDDIAETTGLAIITVDYKGEPVTHHSRCSDFCKLVRKNNHLNECCRSCDSRGGIEAARTGKPYIYRCHMGIVDLAFPIIVDDHYLGALMAGQVLTEKEKLLELETIGYSRLEMKEKLNYRETYHDLQFIPYKKFNAISRMINHMNKHIVNEKTFRIDRKKEKFSRVTHKNPAVTERLTKDKGGIQDHFRVSKKMEPPFREEGAEISELIHQPLKSTSSANKNEFVYFRIAGLNSKILEPAIHYIDSHYKENISLEKIAAISNVSPYYFSRLFKKESGVNFSVYQKLQKIEKGKEMLRKTDLSIENIASKLGYYESGYFTRVFKKSEGVTPSVYRKKVKD
ncbi:PocR ligand-binding domain-containing protein [Eubacteriaceae bacterium ES3]|nr:PocR ligand-binding domain-containing protein [Eubacteriaceae bacterium ES3]